MTAPVGIGMMPYGAAGLPVAPIVGIATSLPLGEVMIGPPGIPKLGRRIFSFAAAAPARHRDPLLPVKWAAALYLAGVLAHFSDHMAYQLSAGQPLHQVLTSAPVCLVWPADLIGTLINLG